MNILLRFIFLVFVIRISTVYSENAAPSEKGPGASSCLYFGGADVECTYGIPVTVNDLPDTCTSFYFDGILINSTHDVSMIYPETEKYFDMLGQDGNTLFINVGHKSYSEWTSVLDSEGCNAKIEAKNIQTFTSNHPGLKGLVITDLLTDPDSPEFVDFTQNVLKYIEIVKNETGYEIGMSFNGDKFLDIYGSPSNVPKLDFLALDSCVEFYSFTVIGYNFTCTDQFKNGVTPINGDAKFTLEKLGQTITKLQIPKDKVYYKVSLSPKSRDHPDVCRETYESKCTFPDQTKDWCADTQETLFEKGQWFQQNGAGFIGFYIDFDDPRNCCNCGKFPAFNAIRAGFNGTASVPPCPLFDGQG